MADRIRTGDRLDHNQELYQLSYSHRAGFQSSARRSAKAYEAWGRPRAISCGSAAEACRRSSAAASSPRTSLGFSGHLGTASQGRRRAASASGWKRTPQALPWRKAWCAVCAEEASGSAPSGSSKTSPCQCRTVVSGARAPSDRVVGVADPHRGEADLRPLARPDSGAERSRQELGAEADAEDRHLEPSAFVSHSRSAARPGWRSTSSTFIGPPIDTAPATSVGFGSVLALQRPAPSCTSRPAQASRIRCGPSQGTCWIASRVGRSSTPGAG